MPILHRPTGQQNWQLQNPSPPRHLAYIFAWKYYTQDRCGILLKYLPKETRLGYGGGSPE